jgi:hypothetical protein
MGCRPAGMTLDRIDNNGDYCKANCKWSTHKEQCANRRSRGPDKQPRKRKSIKPS